MNAESKSMPATNLPTAATRKAPTFVCVWEVILETGCHAKVKLLSIKKILQCHSQFVFDLLILPSSTFLNSNLYLLLSICLALLVTIITALVSSFDLIDIDECQERLHACHSYANCKNALGSYHCSCRTGYAGDGKYCIGIYFL